MKRTKDTDNRDDVDAIVTEIYETYQSMVMGIAYKVLEDKMAAEDVLQETMIKVMRKADYIHQLPPQRARKYIARMAENTAVDEYRKRYRRLRIADKLNENEETVSFDIERVEENYNSNKALQCIPTYQRLLLYMKYCGGYSVKDMAKHFGVTEDAIAGRIKKARQMLREEWQKKKPE